MIKMNKRGQTERAWLWVVYLVLVGISIGIFMNHVIGQDQNSVMQEFYLDDVTFLVNRMLSSEFDIEYEYEIPEEFSVEITDKIKISLGEYVMSREYIESSYKIVYEREGENLILRRE